MNQRRKTLRLEELESRMLLDAGGFGGLGGLASTSAAVQTDQATLLADQAQFQTDYYTLLPTIQQDQALIYNAIVNSATVQAAEKTLASDLSLGQAGLQADVQAVSAATDATTRQTAVTKLYSDYSSVLKTYSTDQTAVQTAANNDPNVQMAKLKLQNDTSGLQAEQAKIQADQQQLQKDVQAASGGTGTPGGLRFGGF